MVEFNRQEALKMKKEIDFRLHSGPHFFVDDVNPMEDTFAIKKANLEVKDEWISRFWKIPNKEI